MLAPAVWDRVSHEMLVAVIVQESLESLSSSEVVMLYEYEASSSTLVTAVLEMLGIDGPALREAFSEGKSVADIADENGVEIGDIVGALVDERADHLAEHVADGSLTEDEAAEKLEAMEAKIAERLNSVPGAGERLRGPKHDRNGHGEFRRGHHNHADDDAATEA